MNAILPQPWAENFLPGYAGFNDSLSIYLGVYQSEVLRSLFHRLYEAMESRLANFGVLAGEALFRRLRAAGAAHLHHAPHRARVPARADGAGR